MATLTTTPVRLAVESDRFAGQPRGRRLAFGAAIGPLAFTLAWLVLGAISPGYDIFGTHIAPYSPITQPISGLGLGVTGPFMNAAFVLCGLVLLGGVAGITQYLAASGRGAGPRITAGALLALTPIGMIMAGLFTLESPLLHLLGALLAFAAPVVSFATAGLLFRGTVGHRALGNWLLVAAPITLVLVVMYFASFDQAATAANQGIAGLTQRVAMLELHFWFVVMGLAAGRGRA